MLPAPFWKKHAPVAVRIGGALLVMCLKSFYGSPICFMG